MVFCLPNKKGAPSAKRIGTPFRKNPGNVLLSHGLHRSTIAAEGLNFRVRNGNGCDPLAMVTEKNKIA